MYDDVADPECNDTEKTYPLIINVDRERAQDAEIEQVGVELRFAREFTVRQQRKHFQFRILTVVALLSCLQEKQTQLKPNFHSSIYDRPK